MKDTMTLANGDVRQRAEQMQSLEKSELSAVEGGALPLVGLGVRIVVGLVAGAGAAGIGWGVGGIIKSIVERNKK